jgi:hypothetical protein
LIVDQLIFEDLEQHQTRRRRVRQPAKQEPTLIHAVRGPTIRSRPISVNEFNTTAAVAPSGLLITASLAGPPRNSSSYPATWSFRSKIGCLT